MSNYIDSIEFMHQPQVRPNVNSANFVDINAIVAKAVADEREECARLAESGNWEASFEDDYYQTIDLEQTRKNIAAAIRARK